MPIRQGGSVAMSSSRFPLGTLGRTRAGLPIIRTMNGKDVLGEIDFDGDKGRHGLPLPQRRVSSGTGLIIGLSHLYGVLCAWPAQ
jgi:hypothetical protein